MSHELIVCESVNCNFVQATEQYVLEDCENGIYKRGMGSYEGPIFEEWPKEIKELVGHHKKFQFDALDQHRSYTVERKGKKIGSIFITQNTISYTKVRG